MEILHEIEKAKSTFEERDYSVKEADRCIVTASRKYGIYPLVIMSIMKVEGGKIGTLSKNSNGTFDLGPMQINTVNLPELKDEFPGLTWKHVAYDLCTNIYVGTYFLSQKVKEADDYWEGVGNYHSKTPSLRKRYLSKVVPAYKNLVEYYKKKARLMAARRRNIHIQ